MTEIRNSKLDEIVKSLNSRHSCESQSQVDLKRLDSGVRRNGRPSRFQTLY
jgi:hypothetical protein